MRLSSLVVLGKALALISLLAPVLAADLALKTPTREGCFESSDPLEDHGSDLYQSSGACQKQCVELGKPVMGMTKGTNCWCGDFIPVADSKVSDSKCSSPCAGYDKENCGGPKAWTVFLTGTDYSVGNLGDSGSETDSDKATITAGPKTDATSTPDNASNPAKSIITQDPTTVVVTAPGKSLGLSTSSSNPESKPSKGSNTAGIAAGAVVGVVVLCALVGGLFFYLRNRKRRAIEDEYHRNATNGNGIGAGRLSSANMSDSRLEPSVMMQRRQSDGSIADNQDYSRRILKVTNPDGT